MVDPDRPSRLKEKCDLLRSLHVPGTPLVLPNAWDVASAKAIVEAGFPVVATTSGGLAAALGYEDHESAPAVEMFAGAARIARSVDVPVTVDAEAGYGMEPADLVDALLGIGAAGCNLEDTDHLTGHLIEPDRHADRLAAIRSAATDREYGPVINARVDVFIANRRVGLQADLLDDAILRARSYLAAGADCTFPIFLHDPDTIAAFVARSDGPVNILALPQAPSLARLGELGVARISYGSMIHRRAMETLTALLDDIKRS
jgi:2-methylisocitrate lyase-like PEP mutase family enzyme